MRRTTAALAIVGLVAVAIVLADLAAPPAVAELSPGSYGFVPLADELTTVPSNPLCDEKICPITYAFSAGKSVVVPFSVSNTGPLPLTLDGVSHAWFAQYGPMVLGRSVRTRDGGNPVPAAFSGWSHGEFQAVLLQPGDQRIIGVDFRTTDDIANACEHFEEGAGIQWDSAPVAWHVLATTHVLDFEFSTPIVFRAPTAADSS